jgi:DNA-binding transcriptional LysR family regulator
MPHRALLRLPSMSALTSFEAVARKRSIVAAARELHLTASAVSKQLRELEMQLGCQLVARTTRNVALTADGEEYLHAIAPLLASLEEATLALRTRAEREAQLDLGVSHSLGNRWLIPRLASFYEKHPEIRLNLTTVSGVPDLAESRLHCALAYCDRPPIGHSAEHVMRLRLFPVIATRLLPAAATVDLHDVLRRHPLLDQLTLPQAWPQFLRQVGIDSESVRFGPRYQLLTIGLQASLSGLGIALLPAYVVQPELDAGRVRRLGSAHLETQASYQLIRVKGVRKTAAMNAFAAWVRQQGRSADEGA